MHSTSQAPPGLDALRETFSLDRIERLVSVFYGRVREDSALGPIFAGRVEDWPTHLARMVTFWRSVLRAEPAYRPDRGTPHEIHRGLEGVTLDHYERWLELFEGAAAEIFEPWAVEHVTGRARRMATTLSQHLRRPDAR